MNALIMILFGLIGLIALLLILALFVKKGYAIEREIIINKPKQTVFDYIKLLKNQDSFSKWANTDPAMEKEYRGTDGTVGFVSAWNSKVKNVGKGEQTIKKITDGENIDFDLHFMKPMEAKAKANMATLALSENETKVKWGFSSGMKYPMNLMLLFMNMEKMLGDDLSEGLNNLKIDLEK
jgi:hypothetical protein